MIATDSHEPPKPPSDILQVSHGEETRELGRGLRTIVIGRDPGCDLTVSGPLASRRHATVTIERDRHVLTDHSINGTYFTDDTDKVMCLKRESATLGSRGAIGLGTSPADDPDNAIQYQCVDAG